MTSMTISRRHLLLGSVSLAVLGVGATTRGSVAKSAPTDSGETVWTLTFATWGPYPQTVPNFTSYEVIDE